MFVSMNRQQQGDLGEASARCWYELRGYVVLLPTGRSPDYDFVADDGARLIKVQVKTSGCLSPYGRYAVTLCTRGGNQSWSGLSKRFSPDRCDELFVVTTDGRRWRFPAAAVPGGRGINVGGQKYASFEVDPGPPLAVPAPPLSLLSPPPAG